MSNVNYDGLLIDMPNETKYRDAVSCFGIAYQCNIQYHGDRDGRFRVHVINSATRVKLMQTLEAL